MEYEGGPLGVLRSEEKIGQLGTIIQWVDLESQSRYLNYYLTKLLQMVLSKAAPPATLVVKMINIAAIGS